MVRGQAAHVLRHRLDVIDEEVVDRGTGDRGPEQILLLLLAHWGIRPLCGLAHHLVHLHVVNSRPLEGPHEIPLLLHEQGPHIHGAGAEVLVDAVREVLILLGQD